MDKIDIKADFYTKASDEVLSALGTTQYGLTQAEVDQRREFFGENILPEPEKTSLLKVFLKQFNNFLVYILLLAAGFSIYFSHYIDAVVIGVVVLINAIFGFVQEYRSEKAVAALKKLVKDNIRVVRNGNMHEIDVKFLVPGDIIFIESGDKLPADARVIESNNLLTNEAALTGESVPQHKTEEKLPKQVPLPERNNMVYSGTVVVGGEGKAVVTATGKFTRLGMIATDVTESGSGPSHFMQKVNHLARQLGLIAILGSVIVMILGWWRGFDHFEVLLLGIASAVSGIPEGLPAVLAIVLAIGVQRMAKNNAIIKHLSSVEPLGMANVICTDKTGTLTKNKMTVTKIYIADKAYEITGTGYDLEGEFWLGNKKVKALADQCLTQMLTIGSLTNHAAIVEPENKSENDNELEIMGDPTEIALVVAAHKADLKKQELLADYKIINNLSFNPEFKMQAVLVERKDSDKEREIFVIGALESILPRCEHLVCEKKQVSFSDEHKEKIANSVKNEANRGHRLIGAALLKVGREVNEITFESLRGMTFVGFFALIDPPREEAVAAIEQCRSAGVRLVIMTGDSKDTALAISRQLGIFAKDEKAADYVFTDEEIREFSDSKFSQIAKEVKILARVSPQTKMRLVKELKRQGNVVAMIGDGVNDAPALKAADIGVAMGQVGTDVAREAAEIILSDDNFASLIKAIREGRVVFNNVRRTSSYLITTNVAEFLILIVAIAIGMPMPLLPIHVLWLNLITDGFPSITLATEPSHGDVLKRPPFPPKTKILNSEVFYLMIIIGVLMVGGTLFLTYPLFKGGQLEHARTMVFASMSLFQLWNVFNMRSMNKSILRLGFFSNKWINLGLLGALSFQFLVMYIPGLREVFSFTALTLRDWLILLPVTFTVVIGVEIYKYFSFKDKRFFKV